MKNRVLKALLVVVAIPSFVLAQRGSTGGRVVDEEGEPLGGVTVELKARSDRGKPRTLTTKDNGTFMIVGLQSDQYILIFKKEGYGEASEQVQIKMMDRTRLGDIVLTKVPKGYIRPEAQEHIAAGVSAVDQQDFQKALDSFLAVAELNPDVPEVHYNLGFAYERLEDMENAVVCYKKALELRPDYYDPLVPLAEMHTRRREWSEAAEYWRRAADLRPQEISPQYNYGAVSLNAGDIDTAKAAFEKVLELDPGSGMTYYQLGMIAAGQAQNEEAVAHLEKYLELEPEGAQATAVKGILETLTKEQ